MFLINLNAESVACILSFRKSRDKPSLESSSKYGFSPDLGGKNGGVLSMRMQVILDSSFARPGSTPMWGGKKGEFRDWTRRVFTARLFGGLGRGRGRGARSRALRQRITSVES